MEKPKFNQSEVNVNNLSAEEQKQHLANYSSAGETDQYLRNVNAKKQGSMLPPLPKPGEVIHCQACQEAMPPEAFSKDPKIRKREFKWHMHIKCMDYMFDLVDRSTPGLISERGIK